MVPLRGSLTTRFRTFRLARGSRHGSRGGPFVLRAVLLFAQSHREPGSTSRLGWQFGETDLQRRGESGGAGGVAGGAGVLEEEQREGPRDRGFGSECDVPGHRPDQKLRAACLRFRAVATRPGIAGEGCRCTLLPPH